MLSVVPFSNRIVGDFCVTIYICHTNLSLGNHLNANSAKFSHPSKYPFAKFREDGAETAPANLVGRGWGENKTNLRIKLTTNKIRRNFAPRAGALLCAYYQRITKFPS